jgi:hypothetical protein
MTTDLKSTLEGSTAIFAVAAGELFSAETDAHPEIIPAGKIEHTISKQ